MKIQLSLEAILNRLKIQSIYKYTPNFLRDEYMAYIKVETPQEAAAMSSLIAVLLDTTPEKLNTRPIFADCNYLEIHIVKSNLHFDSGCDVRLRQVEKIKKNVHVFYVEDFLYNHIDFVLKNADSLDHVLKNYYNKLIDTVVCFVKTKPNKNKNKWVVSHKKNVTILRKAGVKGTATYDGVGRETRTMGLLIAALKALGCKQKNIEYILNESSKQWKTRND